MTQSDPAEIEAIAARARKTREIAAAFPGSDKAASLAQLANDLDALLAALATAEERADKAEAALKCDCGAMGDVHRDFQTRPHTEWCAANYHKATGPQAENEESEK